MQIWLRTHSPSGNEPIVRCWPHHGSGFRADLAKQAAFPTFQVSKQKALVSVRASPIGGEIVADFEETRQFWNFTALNKAGREVLFLKDG